MRELKLILIAAVGALFVGLGLFGLSNAGDLAKKEPVGVPFEVLAEGQYGPVAELGISTERKNFIFRTSSDFNTFWDMVGSIIQKEKPSVIFTKDQAIAVFQGVQNSGGYNIEVTDIRDTPEKRVVFITMTIPGPNCDVTQAITNPYQIIQVPKSDKPLTTIETFDKINCKG